MGCRKSETQMLKILIADDDDILVDLIRFRLSGAGYEVLWAADGEAALEQAKAALPDLIVLDAMMPILTGMEVLVALKLEPTTASIPVIMLTARKGETDIVKAIDAGAADYLTKPFIPNELLSRVASQLKRGSNAG